MDIDFQLRICRFYSSKVDQCKQNGHAFELTVSQVIAILSRKTCYWTGIKMTLTRPGKPIRGTDLTLDRVDNSKGYVPGNVVACCHAANALKAKLECPDDPLDVKSLKRMLSKLLNEDGQKATYVARRPTRSLSEGR